MFIALSEPHELSANFLRVDGAVTRDFDGYLTCTVLYNGIPVAYITDPRSNYGDPSPEHNLPGAQHVLTDDHGQVQRYAHFLHWIGACGEDFPTLVVDVLARPSKRLDNGKTIRPWTFWDAMDEAEDESSFSDRAVWLDDGHAWCGFINAVEFEMYKAFPDEWPKPNEWHGPVLS
jgi:hypothetical protein